MQELNEDLSEQLSETKAKKEHAEDIATKLAIHWKQQQLKLEVEREQSDMLS